MRRVRRPWSTRSTLVGRTIDQGRRPAVRLPRGAGAPRGVSGLGGGPGGGLCCGPGGGRRGGPGGGLGGRRGGRHRRRGECHARQPDRDGRGTRGADDQPGPSAGPRVDPHAMPLSNRAPRRGVTVRRGRPRCPFLVHDVLCVRCSGFQTIAFVDVMRGRVSAVGSGAWGQHRASRPTSAGHWVRSPARTCARPARRWPMCRGAPAAIWCSRWPDRASRAASSHWPSTSGWTARR